MRMLTVAPRSARPASQGVVGRRFMLEARGSELTLWIDLTPNFQTRNTRAQGYVDAQALTRGGLPARVSRRLQN